ncbi:MAG: hypothetical protein JEZ06_15570 [Anaerolineaceae bacterium]|nr:hypothetical protein [Anaerolineaceae bacterium]
MLNFFKKKNQKDEELELIERNIGKSWPSLGELNGRSTQPAVLLAERISQYTKPVSHSSEGKSGNTIIIGFGSSGRGILSQWLREKNQPIPGNVRVVLISPSAQQNNNDEMMLFTEENFKLFTMQLSPQHSNERLFIHQEFCRVDINSGVREYLSRSVQQFSENTTVLIIGSVYDPMVGIMPGLLQILGLIQNDSSIGLKSVTALLSLDAIGEERSLDDGEAYAVLRELGRFTVQGDHVMPRLPGLLSGSVFDSSLLSFLFLVDSSQIDQESLSCVERSETLAQMISEMLHLLTSGENQQIWEDLKNISTQQSNLHKQLGMPIVSTFSLASLILPVKVCEDYLASRLSQEVLFENSGGQLSGFFYHNKKTSSDFLREFLESDNYQHPFFEWLMNIEDGAAFFAAPSLGVFDLNEFGDKFAEKLSMFCNTFVSENITLPTLLKSVRQFLTQIQKVKGLIRTKQINDMEQSDWQNFSHVLQKMEGVLSLFNKEIEAWIELIYSPAQKDSFFGKRKAGSGEIQDPFAAFQKSNQVVEKGKSWEILCENNICEYEQHLNSAEKSLIRRSVINVQSDKTALNRFYRAVVPVDVEDTKIERVLKSLGWNFTLKNKKIEIQMICLPTDWNPVGKTQEALFSKLDFAELTLRILCVCREEVKTIVREFSLDWFTERVVENQAFFERMKKPYLLWDNDVTHNLISTLPNNQRSMYVFSHNENQAKKFKEIVYGEFGPRTNLIATNNATSLIFLNFYHYIPLITLDFHQRCFKKYKNRRRIHVFSQEQNALHYEQSIAESGFEKKEIMLSTRVVMALVDSTLVKVFCRALFCGLLKEQTVSNSMQSGYKNWTFPDVAYASKKFDPIILENCATIWEAFYQFVVKKTNQKNYEQFEPFHINNRTCYLKGLIEMIEDVEGSEEGKRNRAFIENLIREDWVMQANQNSNYLDFLQVLEMELENSWEGIHLEFDY